MNHIVCRSCEKSYEKDYFNCKFCLGAPQNIYFCWKFKDIVNSLKYRDSYQNVNFLVTIDTEDHLICCKFMDILKDYYKYNEENNIQFPRMKDTLQSKCIQLKIFYMLDFFHKTNNKNLEEFSVEINNFFSENEKAIQEFKFTSKELSTNQVESGKNHLAKHINIVDNSLLNDQDQVRNQVSNNIIFICF